jgi:predicted PurR-regulated permease PerM
MPIILLGALGGMVSGGITGMFVGAVLLAVGYRVFLDWVAIGEEGAVAETGQGETDDQAGAGGEAV